MFVASTFWTQGNTRTELSQCWSNKVSIYGIVTKYHPPPKKKGPYILPIIPPHKYFLPFITFDPAINQRLRERSSPRCPLWPSRSQGSLLAPRAFWSELSDGAKGGRAVATAVEQLLILARYFCWFFTWGWNCWFWAVFLPGSLGCCRVLCKCFLRWWIRNWYQWFWQSLDVAKGLQRHVFSG